MRKFWDTLASVCGVAAIGAFMMLTGERSIMVGVGMLLMTFGFFLAGTVARRTEKDDTSKENPESKPAETV